MPSLALLVEDDERLLRLTRSLEAELALQHREALVVASSEALVVASSATHLPLLGLLLLLPLLAGAALLHLLPPVG